MAELAGGAAGDGRDEAVASALVPQNGATRHPSRRGSAQHAREVPRQVDDERLGEPVGLPRDRAVSMSGDVVSGRHRSTLRLSMSTIQYSGTPFR